jgi:hypothetical protein
MDFLPTELPRDASTHLSHCLITYIQELCSGNFDGKLENSGLSSDLLDSIHLYKGVLTDKFKYIEELRNRSPIPHFDAEDSLRRIARVLKSCPAVASDVDNSRFGQKLNSETRAAIMEIARILEGR